MSQDLAEILTGAPVKSPATPKAPVKRDPVDAAIRTVYGEAPPNATREERQAIAAVIANRASESGKGFDEVVQEPGQFEPWQNAAARKRIEGLKADSPEYQAIAADVGDVLAGKANPYPGLTHFYAPEAQAALGRAKPGFDDGSGVQIGKHLFFSQGASSFAKLMSSAGAPEDDPAAVTKAFKDTFGDPSKWGPDAAMVEAGVVPFEGLNETASSGQTELFKTMNKAGLWDPEAAEGSRNRPFFMQKGASAKDAPAGAYFVDRFGKLQRAPGGEAAEGKIGDAFGRGVADVGQSVTEMLPGTQDSVLRSVLTGTQAQYDADFKGDPKMGAGRFAGQVAGTLPLLAGGEAALGSKLLGPTGQFLIGNGGGSLAARGASLAASGALEGGASSALVSSASDQPLGEQMLTGAILGGVAKPLVAGGGAGVRRFVGGKPVEGAAPIAEQQAVFDAAQGLPVPVPMTRGTITGSPVAQMEENLMLKGAKGEGAARIMQEGADATQEALRANVGAISEKIAGKATEVGDGGKAVSGALNTLRDAFKKDIDKAYTTARAKGEDAMLAGATEAREAMLGVLRKDYNLKNIEAVAREVEDFGSAGAPTVREIFDARTRLSNLTQSTDRVVAGAARKAVTALDGYMKVALKNDLILGKPETVKLWKDAIKKRAAFGRIFEGDDLVEDLTERSSRGGDREALAVAPEDATNHIFGKADLGFIGKADMKRDLTRLRTVLGADSADWNALRAEAFRRFSIAGEGAAERGKDQFSGQKFFNAWNKAKTKDPEILGVLFNAEERSLIDRFAEVAQKATTPVKGGDNTSNTALAMKKFITDWFPLLASSGGAGAGAGVAGPGGAMVGAAMGAFFKALGEILNAGKAAKAVAGKPTVGDAPSLASRILGPAAVSGAAVAGANAVGQAQQRPAP